MNKIELIAFNKLLRNLRPPCLVPHASSPMPLSGGERQMLSIARSLMSRPKLILLDEPSSGLAPRVVSRVFEFVRQIKSQGYSILMVEQNVRKALQLSERAYLMESGRVHKEGTRQSFLEDPYIKKAYIGL